MSNSPASFRLANAKVGVDYREVPVLSSNGGQQPVFIAIRVPAELGLYVDIGSGLIQGTPEIAGDFYVELEFYWPQQPHQHLRAQVPLWVSQDPKQLWKNLASDPEALFWRPDASCKALPGAEFNVLAASKRGRSHAHVGSFRDDDYQVAEAAGWVIGCVADGAGSAPYSRRGAEIICQTASHYLQEELASGAGQNLDMATINFSYAQKNGDRQNSETQQHHLQNNLCGLLGGAAQAAIDKIQQELEQVADASFKDFSSTALITLCRRFSFGTLCAAFWVGDGAVTVCHSKGIELLGASDSGEFAGQTRFLDAAAITPTAVAARTRFVLVEELTALLLMTDGITDAFFVTDSSLQSPTQWQEFWQNLSTQVDISQPTSAAAEQLMAWLDFWSPGNHDDRTIVLIQPTGQHHE